MPIVSDATAAWRMIAADPRPIRSAYAGLAPAVAGAMPTAAVYMPTYQVSKAMLAEANVAGMSLAPLAGVATGVITALVRSPTSVVKVGMPTAMLTATLPPYYHRLLRPAPATPRPPPPPPQTLLPPTIPTIPATPCFQV